MASGGTTIHVRLVLVRTLLANGGLRDLTLFLISTSFAAMDCCLDPTASASVLQQMASIMVPWIR